MKKVRRWAAVHVLVCGAVVAQRMDGERHGDEAAVGDFMRVVRVGGGIRSAEKMLSDEGFDAVAADYWVLGLAGCDERKRTE